MKEKQKTVEEAIKKALDNGWEENVTDENLNAYVSLISNNLPRVSKGLQEFAEALWADKWQLHLQQLLIADDPIKYLSDNI